MNSMELEEIETFIHSGYYNTKITARLGKARDIIIRLLAEVECLEEEIKNDRYRNTERC